MKNLTLLLCLLIGASTGFAQTLPPVAKLNRLSKVLRGHSPNDEEREAFAKATAQGRTDAFLDQKIDEYLSSEEHAFKMSLRLEELFRLKSTETLSPDQPALEQSIFYSRQNALNALFSELGRKNLSWDTLLTGKTYHVYNSQRLPGFGLNDYGFLSAVNPHLGTYWGVYSPEAIEANDTWITFDDKDPRIAGAITTSRFFARDVTTGLNKSRRRSAAIFRIFLCDSMSAAVSSSDGQDDSIYDLMFPHDSTMTENELRAVSQQQGDSLHGTRADCMACHSKLDPMGRTMMTSPLVLAPRATPGHLTYHRGTELVDVQVNGVGELGQAITQQPEYEKCQVQHFWGWFFNEKAVLTPERTQILTQEFNRVGRRTNDFIKYLVHQPEFFSVAPPETESEMRARQVKSFFKKCQDCHKDQSYELTADHKIPDFTQWPIAGSKKEMTSWVQNIAEMMDLKHQGAKPEMPTLEAAWRTSFKEMQMIQSWIDKGAPNEKGERMIEP